MGNCKICNTQNEKIFSKTILGKYEADYYKCPQCNFIQTSDPIWLKEAYESAITSLDIGLISRNLYLKSEVSKIINTCFPEAKTMLDFGGGYGMLVRMLRDEGFNFYRQDLFCENLFAQYFDLNDATVKRFDVLTAFEVFEHLVDPMQEIKKMFDYSDRIIFTTLITPKSIKELENWWYLSVLTGQHIALYSLETLEFVANKFGKHFYSNGNNLHIFSDKILNPDQVATVFKIKKLSLFERVLRKIQPKEKFAEPRISLLQQDYNYIEEKLKQKIKP